jgi:two-component system NtrC family sensor kinase
MSPKTNNSCPILVVDDDQMLAESLSDILKLSGYEVAVADSAETAIDLVCTKKICAPSLVLVDLKLPGMDGLELMEQLKKCLPILEYIILTGYASKETAIAAVSAGAYGFIEKPYDIDQLLVTVRHAIEKQQSDNQLRLFRELIDHAGDAVFIIDPQTAQFVDVNATASKFLGYSRDEFLKMKIMDIEVSFFGKDDWKDHVTRLMQKKTMFVEGKQKCKDGSTFPIEANISYNIVGNKHLILANVRNITDRKKLAEKEKAAIEAHARAKAERARADELGAAYEALKGTQATLVQTEKLLALGEMSAGVAHELNSPLAGVLSLMRMGLKDKKTKGEEYEDLKDMEEACTHMANIIRDLTDFSHAATGIRSALDINEIIDKTLGFSAGLMEKRGIKIIKNYDAKLPKVLADKSQMQQIVINMITNARDAIEGRGQFTIRTGVVKKKKKSFVEMSFADTGCGIKKDDFENIFDPFFTTKRPGGGVGLGLSICHTIVKNHGGEIIIESEEGKGTTVRIRIPVTP